MTLTEPACLDKYLVRESLSELDSAISGLSFRESKRVKWRLKYGLLVAGLDKTKCILVSPDDPRAVIFDGRDNPKVKALAYGMETGAKFEVELL